MASRTPRRNLPPAAEPWGRSVDSDIAEIKRRLGIAATNNLATGTKINSATTAVQIVQEQTQKAIQQAEQARAVADTKTITYWTAERPKKADEGDMWFDPVNNKAYRWVITGPDPDRTGEWLGEWVLAEDQDIALAREWIETSGAELNQRLGDAEVELERATEDLRVVREETIPAAQEQIDAASGWITSTGAELDRRLGEIESNPPGAGSGYTFSTAAPTTADGAGKSPNHVWIRTKSATDHKQIGFWHWDGSNWIQHALDPTFIPVLNIGTGTAGDLGVERLSVGTGVMGTGIIDTLWNNVVRSRLITTDMMIVGSGGNLFPDPMLQQAEAWSGDATVTHDKTSGYLTGQGSLLIATGSTQAGKYSSGNFPNYAAPIVGGQAYRVSAFARTNANAAANTLSIYVRFYRKDGSWSFGTPSNIRNTGTVVANTWTEVSGIVTAPADTAYLVIGFYKEAALTTTPVRWSNPGVVTATNSSLIVDGAITAKKITLVGDKNDPDEAGLVANIGKILTLDVENLTATGSSTLKDATITTLWNKVVRSQKITTDMLMVGPGDNLLTDPLFNDIGNSWQNFSWLSQDKTGGRDGGPALKITASTSTQSVYALPQDAIPVNDGDQYRVSVWVKSSTAVAAGTARFVMRVKTTSGTYSYPVASAPALTANVWTRISQVLTVPANAASVSFYLQVTTGMTSGSMWFWNPSVTRATDASLIVDGAIDGLTITGGTIRTAASGKRWELSSANQNKLTGYSGLSNQTEAGYVSVDVHPFGGPQVVLASGRMKDSSGTTYPDAYVAVTGASPTAANPRSEVLIDAGVGDIGPFGWGFTPYGAAEVNGDLYQTRGGMFFGSQATRFGQYHAEWTLPANTVRSSGTWSTVRLVGPNYPFSINGDSLICKESGIYTVSVWTNWSNRATTSTTRNFIELQVAGTTRSRADMGQEDWGGMSWTGYIAANWSVKTFSFQSHASGGINHYTDVTILRHE